MRVKTFLITYGLVASGILSGCRLGHNNNNLSIRVINTDNTYQFEASYNTNKTREIERYITRKLKPTDVFNSKGHQNSLTVILADQTTFRIKSYPGELKIELDKRNNTKRGYDEVNEICRGIQDVLKGKVKA